MPLLLHLTSVRLSGILHELNLMEVYYGSSFIFHQLFLLNIPFGSTFLTPDHTLCKSHKRQITSISCSIIMTHSHLFQGPIQSKSELQSLIPFKASFFSTTQEWPIAQRLLVRNDILTFLSFSFILLLLLFLLPLWVRRERGNCKGGAKPSLLFL